MQLTLLSSLLSLHLLNVHVLCVGLHRVHLRCLGLQLHLLCVELLHLLLHVLLLGKETRRGLEEAQVWGC